MSVWGAVADEWRDRLSAAGLADPRWLIAPDSDLTTLAGKWTPLTKLGLGGRQRWRWELPAAGGEHTPQVLYVKRYERTPLRAQFDRCWRQTIWHSRAWWEYTQSQQLAAKYLAVPPAVACAEQMCGPWERTSAVILAAVPGDGFDRAWQACLHGGGLEITRAASAGAAEATVGPASLPAAAGTEARPTDARRIEAAPVTRGAARFDVVERLARFVTAFHQTGLTHRDLYLCHVFAELDPSGRQPPRFSLIDLARTHRLRWRRTRWLVKDLAQLDFSARQIGASRGDRLRFLENYLGLLRGAARVHWYARAVAAKSDAILRRQRRKGRA